MESRENPKNELPVRIMTFVHDRLEQETTTTLQELIIQFQEEKQFLFHLDKLMLHGAMTFDGNIIKLHTRPNSLD